LGALVFEVTGAGVANGTARDGEIEEELDVLFLDQENINYPIYFILPVRNFHRLGEIRRIFLPFSIICP
jgi:hypothetical protein